jgi:hypothetical protein
MASPSPVARYRMRLFLATVVAMITASAPSAANQQPTYQGVASISALEPACAAAPLDELRVGTTLRLQLMVRRLPGNPGDKTSLIFIAGDAVFRMQIDQADFTGSGAYKGDTIDRNTLVGSTNGSFLGAQLTPPEVDFANVPTVTLIAAVSHFFGTAGCNVIFEAHLARWRGANGVPAP